MRLASLLLALLVSPARAADRSIPVVSLPAAPIAPAPGATLPGQELSALSGPSAIPTIPAVPALPASKLEVSAPPRAPGAQAPAASPAAQAPSETASPAADAASATPSGAPAPGPRPGETRERWVSRLWSKMLGERPGETYQNPVFAGNVPDPGIVRDGKTYYVTGTSNRSPDKFPVLKSTNLRDWTHVGHLFPADSHPSWADGFFWAPEIHRVGKSWVAYFTAEKKGGRLALGAASADRIEGPWKDLGRPMLENDHVGLIDSHRFEDYDGRHYMYWKEDSNGLRPKERTGLFVQELSRDGLSLIGERKRLIENDLDWEGDLIEGPWVERHGKYYYLYYSANAFFNDKYAVGVARATSPMGPFEKLGRPILRSNAKWIGPGHNSVIRRANWADRARAVIARSLPNGSLSRRLLSPLVRALARLGGRDYIVYHAWEAGRVGGKQPFASTFNAPFPQGENPRMLLIDRLHYENGWPRVEDGTPSVEPRRL